jgi:hypothetical protein
VPPVALPQFVDPLSLTPESKEAFPPARAAEKKSFYHIFWISDRSAFRQTFGIYFTFNSSKFSSPRWVRDCNPKAIRQTAVWKFSLGGM